MMNIKLNGELEKIEGGELTVARLLELKNVESPDMVSVQHNGEIIARDQYKATSIQENDELEFLYFMGGGAV